MEASARLHTPDAMSLHLEAQRLNLRLYQPSEDHDLLFTRWWSYLLQTNQFSPLFPPTMRALSRFLSTFSPPTYCLFATHNSTISYVLSIHPYASNASGAFINLWCRPDLTSTKLHARYAYLSHLFATTAYPTILAFTPRTKLLRSMRLLGYTLLGTIPSFIEGHDAYTLFLTRSSFLQSDFTQRIYPRIRKE